MKRIFYLAYGSNLNIYQMKNRCPSAKPLKSLELEGYRLVYRGCDDNYAYLTIEKHEGSIVPVELYQLSPEDIPKLDYYEGYPTLYRKEYFNVKVNFVNKEALIYVMNSAYGYHKPSAEYLDICAVGYENYSFDMNILNKAYTDTIEEMGKQKRR